MMMGGGGEQRGCDDHRSDWKSNRSRTSVPAAAPVTSTYSLPANLQGPGRGGSPARRRAHTSQGRDLSLAARSSHSSCVNHHCFYFQRIRFKTTARAAGGDRGGTVGSGASSPRDAPDPCGARGGCTVRPGEGTTYSAGWAHGCRSLGRPDESADGSRCPPGSRAGRSCVPSGSRPPELGSPGRRAPLRRRRRRKPSERRSRGREEHSFFHRGHAR